MYTQGSWHPDHDVFATDSVRPCLLDIPQSDLDDLSDRLDRTRRPAGRSAELMRRPGYERFGAQGGDRGATITREPGRAHPDRVTGVHLNLLPGWDWSDSEELPEFDRGGALRGDGGARPAGG
ncbi:hypothetical protein ABZ016_18430 [Streptomyces sp. NPDC006372]|uniref:hypothetical protein n=1 Tax=Streptomyces sp. NPDC006372 TaxID=3155599 RepID=UPI0033B537B0